MKTRIEAIPLVPLKSPPTPTTGYSPCGQNGISPSQGNADPPGHESRIWRKLKRQLPSPTAKHRDCPEEKAAPLSMPVMKSLPAN